MIIPLWRYAEVIQLQYTGLAFHHLLPGNIKLISGPGCPVCVTGTDFIDKAIAYSKMEDVIIALWRSDKSTGISYHLLKKKKQQEQISELFFQGWKLLKLQGSNPGKKIIFLGIGFETTAPGTAVTIKAG